MVVLAVMKWDIHPDKREAYLKWTDGAIKRTLAVPGLVEFRAYRGVVGAPEVVVSYEFANLTTWATWRDNEEIRKVLDELHTLALNVTTELWGPSPVVPEPIRPSK